jgi:excisionase family DNA binding protein
MTPKVEYLTIAEVCRELRVCRGTLKKLVRMGEILRVKIGRRRLIPRRELERFVARNMEKPPQEANGQARGKTASQVPKPSPVP